MEFLSQAAIWLWGDHQGPVPQEMQVEAADWKPGEGSWELGS